MHGISFHLFGKYLPKYLSWSLSVCKSFTSFSSFQFGRSVVSDPLRPHELQHTRPPCSAPTPGVHSNSRPSSWGCHPAISSSVVPFSSCPQSLSASKSFPMSQFFAWGGQSIGVSALASSPITSWQIGKQWKQWETLFSWAPKSLQMVTAALKLKDACSLKEKLWQI